MLTKENRIVILCLPESEKNLLPSQEEVISAMDQIAKSDLDRFVPVRKKGIEFNSQLQPVPVVNKRSITNNEIKLDSGKQLDSTVEYSLSNGARVIWNETRGGEKNLSLKIFRKGGYSLNMNVLDIKILEKFLQSYLVNGLNKKELAKYLFGKSMGISPNLSYRFTEMNGSCKIKDTVDFFKLINIYFTDISVDERDVKNFKSQLLKSLNTSKGVHSLYEDSVKNRRYLYYPLSQELTTEAINSITAEKLMDLYKEVFYNPTGYTFVFSGPLAAQEAKPLIEKYIATIPATSITASDIYSQTPFYKEPIINSGEIVIRYKGDNLISSKASVTRYYHVNLDYTAANYLNIKVLTYILRERYMKSIREERGGTYHVGVSYDLLRQPEGIAQITIEFDTDPKLVDDLLGVVQQEFETFAKFGPTEKEIKEVKLYLEKTYQDKQKEEFSWTSAISNSIQDNPQFQYQEEKLLPQIDSKSLKKIASKLLKSKNRMTFVFEPK